MNTRWLKTLAIFVATGASAAALVKALGRFPAGPPTAPGRSRPPEPPAHDAPAPAAGVTPASPGFREVAVAAPPEGQAPMLMPTEPTIEEPPPPAAVEPSPPAVPEDRETAARETAVLYAYEAVEKSAAAGERVTILSIGDVQVTELDADVARVAVPLELSHQAPGHVPRKRHARLLVRLRGEPDAWRVSWHEWA